MILSLGWSCAGTEPFLQHVPPQFFTIGRVSSSRFSISALNRFQKWTDSVLLRAQQTQNWFFTNLFGSACLARIRKIGCVKLIPTSWKRSSFPSMHLGRVAQLAEQLTLNQ
jgi:hypothetical protein